MKNKLSVLALTILTVVIILYFVFSWIDGSKRLDQCECVACDVYDKL